LDPAPTGTISETAVAGNLLNVSTGVGGSLKFKNEHKGEGH
jgi:hypothetical protein